MADFLISLCLLWPCCYLFWFLDSPLQSDSVPQVLPPLLLPLKCQRFPPCVSQCQSPLTVGAGLQQWAGRLLRVWDREHFTVTLSEFAPQPRACISKMLLWWCLRFWCVCTSLTRLCSTSHPNWHVPSWSPTAAAFCHDSHKQQLLLLCSVHSFCQGHFLWTGIPASALSVPPVWCSDTSFLSCFINTFFSVEGK